MDDVEIFVQFDLWWDLDFGYVQDEDFYQSIEFLCYLVCSWIVQFDCLVIIMIDSQRYEGGFG